jgi:hypothetical protein
MPAHETTSALVGALQPARGPSRASSPAVDDDLVPAPGVGEAGGTQRGPMSFLSGGEPAAALPRPPAAARHCDSDHAGPSTAARPGGGDRWAVLHVSPLEQHSRVTVARSRAIGTWVLIALLTGTMAGCTAPTTRTTVTATATPTISPSPSPNSVPSSSSPSARPSVTGSEHRTDPNAPGGQCADSVLRVTVQNDPEGSGAGQRAAFVVFRNAGTSTCHLEGTPGLSLVGDSNGTRLGKPAARGTKGSTDVAIPPGGYALAPVTYTFVDKTGGNYGDGHGHDPQCEAQAADGYRIYPPHSYKAFYSASKTYACTTDTQWITVYPTRSASSTKGFTPKP